MRFFKLTLLTLAVLVLGNVASAQDSVPQMPAMQALPSAALDDGAPIRLSPDGPAVIKLDEDATSIIIGNPAHATALLENPRLMMLMPALPGATKVMALNRDGKAIFNRHVLVGTGRDGFKRISRVCNTSTGGNCVPVSMYYCPGKCYETAVTQPGTDTGATGDIANPVGDAPDNPAQEDAEQGISDGMSVLQ